MRAVVKAERLKDWTIKVGMKQQEEGGEKRWLRGGGFSWNGFKWFLLCRGVPEKAM